MRREDWEQDLRERQRNLVFPDTVRNEGIFLRSLLRSNRPLPAAQRIGLFLIAIPLLLGGCVGLAAAIASFLQGEDAVGKWIALIAGGVASLGSCLFGGLMVLRAVLSPVSSDNKKSTHPRSTRPM